MICMQYKLENPTLNSRRGKYHTATLQNNPLKWTPVPIDLTNPRHKDVTDEIRYSIMNRLSDHKYWANEPTWWINEYQKFYTELFGLNWLHENADRHNVVVNKHCCLTLVQYHNHKLTAYSRSTDMRNGYFSDKLILDYLAHYINSVKPELAVTSIEWFMAVPHAYTEKGIARLIEKDEENQ